MTNSIPEIGNDSDAIFIIGSNTGECHPLIARQVIRAKERGAKLIVADPRKTDMALKADLYINLPVGYNIALVCSMMHVIVKENLHKQEFIAEHSIGFEELARSLADYSPEVIGKMCNIPPQQIVEAARIFANAKAAATLYAMGITQFSHGTANVVSLSNLHVITGQIGRPGAGICPLRGQNNVQGACDMGALPNVYPAYQAVNNETVAADYEKAWGVPLSRKVGAKITQVPTKIEHGEIHTLVVFGENPLMSDPDSAELRHAFHQLDLMVVMDMFMTESARRADVVLPAAGWPEKEGTFSNTERRVQRVRAAVPPPDGAKADWWIFGELAKRMGYDGMSYNNAEEIWDELRRMAPKQFGGLSYAHLEANPGLQWPCPDENHPGTPVLHRNGNFSIAGNKANLFPVLFDVFNLPEEKGKTYTKPLLGRIVEHADAEYPLLLTTGRRIMHYHTGTMTRKSSVLDALAPEELIEVNTEDANELSISEGDFIRIDTRRGHIVARATVTDRIQKGLIFGTFHFWEANCNELTSAGVVDPIAGIPEYKISAARLSKSTLADFDAWGVTIRELCGLDLEYKGCKPKPKTKKIYATGEDNPESDQSRRKYSEKPAPTR